MVEFENVYLSFSTTMVLKNLSFKIEEGRQVCLAGKSGSGKSSALKIIQGYILPDKGRVEVGGLSLSKEKIGRIRKKIAYVPQNINLPVSSGKELAKLLGIVDNHQKINESLENLGLSSDMFFRSFDQMSGGQKQRIIISICLSLEREILLLDEPTSSLDDESIKMLVDVICNLKNVTVVSASHNHLWIKAMDNVIYM